MGDVEVDGEVAKDADFDLLRTMGPSSTEIGALKVSLEGAVSVVFFAVGVDLRGSSSLMVWFEREVVLG